MGYYEFQIQCDSSLKEPLIALLSNSETLGILDKDNVLLCYYNDTKGIDSLLSFLQHTEKALISAAGIEGLNFNYTYLSERDWNESWKKRFVPIDIGKHITILPPWETKKPDRINVIIDPGMAFGTGHHETTRKCLEIIMDYSNLTTRDSFADLGTGTGILAIFASLIGFRTVYALDNDPLAIDAAQRNARENQRTNIQFMLADVYEARGQFDMIVANLIFNVLYANSHRIAQLLRPSGIVILSGLIKGQEGELISILTDRGLKPIETFPNGTWVTVVMKKDCRLS